MRLIAVLVVISVTAIAGCGRDARTAAEPAAPVSSPSAAKPAPAPKAARPRIVFLGDSITAGLGLSMEMSYPSLIGARLEAEGFQYDIVNAGVSGDTSAGGLRRLDWALEGDVKVLVLALGGNDGLRGLPPSDLKKNLAAAIEKTQASGVAVILAGMEAPPNNGPEYTEQFRRVYGELAKQYRVRFVPFLLQGVAGESALNQADGIHPNARGAKMVADLVWSELAPLVARPNSEAR